jgi:FKBP-type peptidyl-prolyl cis-trans isomerase FklB
MRHVLAIVLVGSLASLSLAQEKVNIQLQSGPKPGDVAGYNIGFSLGSQLQASGFTAEDLVVADFVAGLTDALKGVETRVTEEEARAAFEATMKKLEGRAMAKATSFLEENKKQQGVVVLPSGLQYQVLKSGSGASPTATGSATVHYEGKLIDGKVFDSSLKRGEPATFKVNQVVPGWTEALTRMKVGDKWRIVLPPNLAYGAEGFPPVIPPNSVLVFELELLETK